MASCRALFFRWITVSINNPKKGGYYYMIYDEGQKKELSFNINAYSKPMEYSGKGAWTRQILNIIFMTPGTFPSAPEIGLGLTMDTYMDTVWFKENFPAQVKEQVSRYFPEIPFDRLIPKIADVPDSNDIVVKFGLIFNEDSDSMEVVTVAAQKVHNMINFEISM